MIINVIIDTKRLQKINLYSKYNKNFFGEDEKNFFWFKMIFKLSNVITENIYSQ